MQCQSNYNLGTFANAILCATEAVTKPRRCDQSGGNVMIMWGDGFSINEASWGCRCCKSGAVFTNHTIWSLMTFAVPTTAAPTSEPIAQTTTAEPTADLSLKDERGVQCQSNYNLGTFANSVLCAAVALEAAECDTTDGVEIMWDDYYSVYESNWGCRCCKANAVYSNHSIWTLMSYDYPGGDSNSWPTPMTTPQWMYARKQSMHEDKQSVSFTEWLSEGTQFIRIPDKLPTSFVVTVAVLVLLLVAFFRCNYWKKQEKSYEAVGLGMVEGGVSDSETDIDVAEPMNV